MKETKFFRKQNVIRGPEGDKVFPSVSKAKKESRAIQAANGGMGCGVLRVVEKMPPLQNDMKDAGTSAASSLTSSLEQPN